MANDCPSELKRAMDVLYNLSGTETSVLYYLCGNEARVSEMAEDLEKDRSTVQRYLSKLRSIGLVKRESRVEEGKKGRYYVYMTPPEEKLKEEVLDRLDEWVEEQREAIQNLE